MHSLYKVVRSILQQTGIYFCCYFVVDGILSPQQTLPPALPPKSPRLVPVPQRRTISGPPSGTGGELQTKLRRLLNTDSKENMFFPDSPPQSTVQSNGVPTREEKFRYSPGSLSPGCRDEDRVLVRRKSQHIDLHPAL